MFLPNASCTEELLIMAGIFLPASKSQILSHFEIIISFILPLLSREVCIQTDLLYLHFFSQVAFSNSIPLNMLSHITKGTEGTLSWPIYHSVKAVIYITFTLTSITSTVYFIAYKEKGAKARSMQA